MANKLQQLRVFVNERLTAAAEEIFSAVERTILEYRNDIYLSKEDVKHSGLLLLAEGLNRQVQVEVFTAENISLSTFCGDNCIYLDVAVFSHNCVVEEDLTLVYIGNCDNDKLTLFSQEVSVSEAEASTQPTHSADAFPEPQEHRASRDQEKLQDLSQRDTVACFKNEQSMQPSSCCQTQTETSREEELLPITSAEWLKTEEEEDGYGGSETANFWQPLSSDSMDEDDTSDAEFTQRGGSNSCSKTVKSKKRAKQRLLGKALVSPHIEQQQCLLRTPVSANVMMQIQAKAATLPMHPALLTGKKRKRCQCCPNKKDTKTSTVCIKCQKYICKAHTQAFKFCPSCI